MNISLIHRQVIATSNTFLARSLEEGRAASIATSSAHSCRQSFGLLIATLRMILEVLCFLQNCTSTLVSIFWHPLQPARFFGAKRRHHVRTRVLVAAYISHIVDEMQKGTMARIEPGLMCRLHRSGQDQCQYQWQVIPIWSGLNQNKIA
jgi:hypothetical protein